MRRPHAGEALGLGFDHRPEIVSAVGTLLLQVQADRGEVLVTDRLREHRAIALGAKRMLDGVRAQQEQKGTEGIKRKTGSGSLIPVIASR